MMNGPSTGCLVRWLKALGLILVATRVIAVEPASLPPMDSISLPSVSVEGRNYEVVLQRQQPGGLEFVVGKVLPRRDQLAPIAAYSSGMLDIPTLQVGATEYRLQLQLVQNSPLLFRLVTVTPLVPQGVGLLDDGRGGFNYEPVAMADIPGFDKARSLAAFRETLYPYLRSSTCIACHSADVRDAAGAQAPLHADSNIELAHDYALTRVNFADPVNSKLVVRMGIDRHNCPRADCAQAADDMLTAVSAWKRRMDDMLPVAQRLVAADVTVSEQEMVQWIAADKATLPAADRDYIIYTSLHELHNEGLSAAELDIVRAGLSKALNSVARWAPAIVNPVDVNGKGLLYKFDMRDYWGWNKGVTRLLFGGSDDDLAFGRNKRDYRGNLVSGTQVQSERYNYTREVTRDPAFAQVIWERVLHGNVEGAVTNGTIPPYINGFRGKRSRNAAGEYIEPADFEWVEASQLIYTLTRPDVYNAIMLLPMYADQLEDELGVDRSRGMDSYDYVISYDAITVDSRLLWRASRKDGGWYWKTWDVFTGQLAGGDRSIFDVYREGGSDIRFPWWANPVPVFVDWRVDRKDTTSWSFVASLAQPYAASPAQIPAGCDPQPNFSRIQGFYNCRHFTGTGGLQQSASEIIWDLPNGLQGYMLTGAFNQRRVDAFVNIVRDPRVIPTARDDIATRTGFTFGKTNGIGGFNDPRLNVGSSCIGCHIDGLNRINNNLRDWVDEQSPRLPTGPYGVDGWIKDAVTVQRVKELYPPSSEIRPLVESARKTFLEAMAEIKQGMMVGPDRNLYVEPVIWTVEHVQRRKYKYPQTTSN